MTQSLSQFINWYRENEDCTSNFQTDFILYAQSIPDIVADLEDAECVMLARIRPTGSNYGNADFLAREFLKKYFPEKEL